MKIILVCLALISFFGCTDTLTAHLKSYGSGGSIVCYSGGVVIYQGDSTGKIATVSGSDGWEFMDKGSNRLVRVTGDCIIRN